ncbi:unnamed protein product [Spirodela intermedia]|uniref:Uncharacterized protein n=1 Tax=Spirodela intermedia TaxID=51605 RepID=A0A7I8JX49_SPIIN|nr:unnamed protein product [Spirodela intermedia]
MPRKVAPSGGMFNLCISSKRRMAAPPPPFTARPWIMQFHEPTLFAGMAEKTSSAAAMAPHLAYIPTRLVPRVMFSSRPLTVRKPCTIFPRKSSPSLAHAQRMKTMVELQGWIPSFVISSKTLRASSRRPLSAYAMTRTPQEISLLLFISSNIFRAISGSPESP